MKIERTASATIPADAPLTIHTEARRVVRCIDRERRMRIDPICMHLPKLHVDLGSLHIRLPKIRVHAVLRIDRPGMPDEEDGPRHIDADWGRIDVTRQPVQQHLIESRVEPDDRDPILIDHLERFEIKIETAPLRMQYQGTLCEQ